MKIRFESVGGFTGPAGREVIELELDELAPERAARLRRLVEAVPAALWGTRLLLPHPRSFDFHDWVRIKDGDLERGVEYHSGAAPKELRALVTELRDVRDSQ